MRGERGVTREGRLVSLLEGQRSVFEQIARGVPLSAVLDRIVEVIEAHLRTASSASVTLADDSRPEPDAPSSWSVPIPAADGRIVGTLAVHPADDAEPDEEDRAVLHAFVQAAAVAIERAHDLEEMARRQRSAEMLDAVSRAIHARLDLGEIVQRATDAATELTGAAFGAFFYNAYDDDGEGYLLYTLSGAPREAFASFPMPRNTEVFGPTFRGEATVRLADVRKDRRFGRNPPFDGMPPGHLPVCSYLATPVLASDGEVLGGLFFGHPEPGVFDAEAERLAEGVAAQAAVAVENARLYEAAQREIAARRRAFAERDHVARVLQESLRPPALPSIPGVDVAAGLRSSMADIGGDFYDVFALHDGRWAFVIGDVCGKGPEAATLTALARHTVRATAVHDARPEHVLAQLNATLLEVADGERFCTALYGVLEPRVASARLSLCRAGHPPALLLAPEGVRPLGGPGTLLGVFEQLQAETVAVELGPGEGLVLHTDGLTDVRREPSFRGADWVADRLRDAIGRPARDIVEHLSRSAQALERPEDARDDIAVLALTIPAA